MIVWSIWDIIGIAFWILVILAFIFVCIMTVIKNELHNIFRRKKARDKNECKADEEVSEKEDKHTPIR